MAQHHREIAQQEILLLPPDTVSSIHLNHREAVTVDNNKFWAPRCVWFVQARGLGIRTWWSVPSLLQFTDSCMEKRLREDVEHLAARLLSVKQRTITSPEATNVTFLICHVAETQLLRLCQQWMRHFFLQPTLVTASSHSLLPRRRRSMTSQIESWLSLCLALRETDLYIQASNNRPYS